MPSSSTDRQRLLAGRLSVAIAALRFATDTLHELDALGPASPRAQETQETQP